MFSICCKVVLYHEEVKKDPRRITKLKPFMSKYKWEGVRR